MTDPADRLREIAANAVQSVKVVAERAILAAQVVSNIQALPPNYTQGEKFGYMQLVPDYTNPALVQRRIDKANSAEAKMIILIAQTQANAEARKLGNK